VEGRSSTWGENRQTKREIKVKRRTFLFLGGEADPRTRFGQTPKGGKAGRPERRSGTRKGLLGGQEAGFQIGETSVRRNEKALGRKGSRGVLTDGAGHRLERGGEAFPFHSVLWTSEGGQKRSKRLRRRACEYCYFHRGRAATSYSGGGNSREGVGETIFTV